MKINIIPKKEIIEEIHPIEFNKGVYLYNNEDHPSTETPVLYEVKKPSLTEANVRLFDVDYIAQEKELDKTFSALNDYNNVTALYQEQFIRGTK